MANIVQKLFNAEPSDPLRCQAQSKNNTGQCSFLSVAGMQRDGKLDGLDLDPERDYSSAINCPKHGGTKTADKIVRQSLHDYRLQIWQERVSEFSESDNVKTLRGEVGVLRLLLENTLNQCQTQQDLILYSHKISDLATKIERLVHTCDRLENRMGMVLDQAAAMMLAAQIVDVISKQVHDPTVIDTISGGIIDAIVGVIGHNDG